MKWCQKFFDKTYSEFDLKNKERKAKKQVDFILKILKIPKNALILDLACGLGRHSIELSKRGYNVVGVDFKREYIRQCKEKARKFRLKTKFMQGDMRKLKFKNKFDVVLNLFTSFGYFSDDENLDVLRKMARALKKNGKIIMDVSNRDFIIKHFRKSRLSKLKPGYLLEERKFDFSTSRINATWTFLSKNKRKISEKKISCRIYSYHELKNMFEKVGIKIIKNFGSFKGEPISAKTKRLIIVGKKL